MIIYVHVIALCINCWMNASNCSCVPGITVGSARPAQCHDLLGTWSSGCRASLEPRLLRLSRVPVAPYGNGLWTSAGRTKTQMKTSKKTWNKHNQTHLCKALQSYTPFQAALVRMPLLAPLPLKGRNYREATMVYSWTYMGKKTSLIICKSLPSIQHSNLDHRSLAWHFP